MQRRIKNIALTDETISKGDTVAAMSGKKLKGYIEDHISSIIEREFKELFKYKPTAL